MIARANAYTLTRDLKFRNRVLKAGRTITITKEEYKRLQGLGYFDPPPKPTIIAKPEQIEEEE